MTDVAAAGAHQRCGLVAIVGRPNVGKSTLLNALVGQKVSITSAKAQTTRHRITGIRTVAATQFVFVDTPGFQTRHGNALNRNLNRTVRSVLSDVDVVLFVVEAGRFSLDDAKVLALLPEGKPVLLVANKLDEIKRRADLMPWLASMRERRDFAEFVPLSAKKPADVERLLAIVAPYLPEQDWFYEEDALTDRSERFLASELIREKLFRLTGDELPYSCTVVIDKFEEEGNLRRIAATDRGRARSPQGHGHRRRRRAPEAHRQRGAPGTRTAVGRQGVPRAVGQGALRLGRQRGAFAQLRLRVRQTMASAFDAFLQQAWADHADQPEAVALRLRTDTPAPETADQLSALVALVVHLCGEHLGCFDDGRWRLAALAGHPLADATVQSALRVGAAGLTLAETGRAESAPASRPKSAFAARRPLRRSASGGTQTERATSLLRAARDRLAALPHAGAAVHRPLASRLQQHGLGTARPRRRAQRRGHRRDARHRRRQRVHWSQAGTWLEVERGDYGLASVPLVGRTDRPGLGLRRALPGRRARKTMRRPTSTSLRMRRWPACSTQAATWRPRARATSPRPRPPSSS